MMTWWRENWRLYRIRCEIWSEINGIVNVTSFWVSSWDRGLLVPYLSLINKIFLVAKTVRLVMRALGTRMGIARWDCFDPVSRPTSWKPMKEEIASSEESHNAIRKTTSQSHTPTQNNGQLGSTVKKQLKCRLCTVPPFSSGKIGSLYKGYWKCDAVCMNDVLVSWNDLTIMSALNCSTPLTRALAQMPVEFCYLK